MSVRKGDRLNTKNLKIFIVFSIFLGLCVRLFALDAMEWKEDEQFNFNQSQQVGTTLPWPWVGIGSGVYIPNPGMSVWIFVILGKVFGATTPVDLQRALGIFSVLSIAILIPLLWKTIKEAQVRLIWLLSLTLVFVNPFHVVYERKLWPEGFLPFFSILAFLGWWNRSRFFYALLWGLASSVVGHIHMSGFFFGFALFMWTLLLGPALEKNALGLSGSSPPQARGWQGYFLGVFMGTLPLIPWFIYISQHPTGQSVGSGWGEALQLKYWVFWFTDPTGLHLGNPLGLLLSQSLFGQIEDFVRAPLINGQPTYLCGLAHVLILLVTVSALLKARHELWTQGRQLKWWLGLKSPTAFLVSALFFGCGLALTLTTVRIRRYYLVVTTPLEFITLIYLLKHSGQSWLKKFAMLWICELIISSCFVWYVNKNDGSIWGDYGISYRKQIQSQQTAPQGTTQNARD